MTTVCFDLKKTIIEPALTAAGLQTDNLATLLDAIALAEQGRHRPNRHGPFGMTAWMHRRVWDQYIVQSPDLACRIRGLASQRRFLDDPHLELDLNWGYATALAGLNCLFHAQGMLPEADQSDAAVELWRRAFHRGHRVDDRLFRSAFGGERPHGLVLAA